MELEPEAVLPPELPVHRYLVLLLVECRELEAPLPAQWDLRPECRVRRVE